MSLAAHRLASVPGLKRLGTNPTAAYLAKGLSATLVIRLTATGLSFLTILVLSRLLGAEGYGHYAYIMAVVAILDAIAVFGMPTVVTREVAACRANHDGAGVRGVAVFALMFGIASSSAVAACYWLFYELVGSYLIVALLLPLAVLSGNLAGLLRGFKRIIASKLPGPVLKQLALLLLLLLAHWGLQYDVAVEDVLVAAVLAAALSLAVFAVLTLHALRRELGAVIGAVSSFRVRPWLSAGFAIALVAVLAAVNNHADIMLLRWLAGPEATGLFHVATRNANLLTFLQFAVIAPLGPLAAEMYAQGNVATLAHIVRRTTGLVFAVTLVPALGMILAGPWYLALFGAEFSQAAGVLAILAVAQLINVAAGPLQMLLFMTGYQRAVAKWTGISAVVNIGLNCLLIPLYGIFGAAVATGAGIILINVSLSYEVRRSLGVDISVVSYLRPRLLQTLGHPRRRRP